MAFDKHSSAGARTKREEPENVRDTVQHRGKHHHRPGPPAVRRSGAVQVPGGQQLRRRTSDGTWEHGNSLYVNVNCWGNLATGASASLTKGDAVVVVGHVHTDEYDDKDGVRRSSVEVRATAVGPDLSRCTARIAPLPKPTAGQIPEPEPAGADHSDAGGMETELDDGDLPLSA